ncbi:MAG: CehA/McbA family metallohydrolase [Candidatus Sericytochromatia bacterium]|nr:CehA/McbA family metallohydrolase [Candidatus Sericytochromatia bacterium]
MGLGLLAGWVLVSYHNHSFHSPDSRLTAGDFMRFARGSGLDAVIVTDHDNVRAARDPSFLAVARPSGGAFAPVARRPEAPFLMFGEEWGTFRAGRVRWGHVGLIGLEDGVSPLPDASLSELLAGAGRRGVLAIINHPFNWALSWRGTEPPAGAHGIEVWNQSWTMPVMENARALAWWDAALRKGRRLLALGGADTHGLEGSSYFYNETRVDRPVNLVWAERPDAASVLAALRAGRVMVARDASAPGMVLDVDGLGPGEVLAAGTPGRVRVRLVRARGCVLQLHTAQGLMHLVPVTEDRAEIRCRLPLLASGDFVRAELRRPAWGGDEMEVLSNPVYVSPGPL